MSRAPEHFSFRFEPLEARRLLFAPTQPFPIVASGNVLTDYANAFTEIFRRPGSTSNPLYTGSDGVYSIPLDGIDRLGSAYNTPKWQLWTFGDSFIGSYNATTGLRNNGTKLVNNTAAVHQISGAAPSLAAHKWRGNWSLTPAEQMAVISRPTASASSFYWPLDGVVVNGQLVQFALRQNSASLETQGVAVLRAPLDSTFDVGTDWPYSGVENTTWFNSDNRGGINSARNVFLADTSSTNAFNGPRAMGAAILDTSSVPRAYVSDGYIYTFGTQLGSAAFSKYAYVSRSTPADYANTTNWQHWSQLPGEAQGTWRGNGLGIDAIGWGTALKDVQGNFITDIASEFSVMQLPSGQLAMIYSRYDFLGGGQIAVRYAASGHPEGPWTSPNVVYTVSTPNSGNAAIGLRAMPLQWANENWFYGVYGAKAHPQLSRAPSGKADGRLLVSYHVLPLDGSPGSGSQLFGPEFTYGDIYRPRFIELTIPALRNERAQQGELLPVAQSNTTLGLGDVRSPFATESNLFSDLTVSVSLERPSGIRRALVLDVVD